MTIFKLPLAVMIGIILFVVYTVATASEDPRYGDAIIRNSDGTIYRSAAAIAEFRTWHPCPSTLLYKGACPGWAINHSIPLACLGKDVAWNMLWMPVVLKAGQGLLPIDRWERKIYCKPRTLVAMPLSGRIIIQ